jgi:acyl carrier protein
MIPIQEDIGLTSRVIAIIAEQEGLDASTVSLDSKLEDLGMDSLDAVQLVIALEEEFDIEIGNDFGPMAHSVLDMALVVRNRIAAK